MSGAREDKPAWNDVPVALRHKIETLIGAEVAAAEIVWGGFGPSATFVLTAGDGTRYFCKGTHPGQTREGHTALQHERVAYERFPELETFGPRYLGGADDGEWHVAVLEYVPRAVDVPPWTEEAVDRAIALIATFHRGSPEQAARLLTPADVEHGWVSLARDAAERDGFAQLFCDPAEAMAWLDTNVARLAGAEGHAQALGGPKSWLHLDIRSDNLVFARDGSVELVDWPLLCFGPSLMDIAFFLPSLAGEGGPSCADGLRLYEQKAGLAFDAADIATAAAAVSGFFAARAGMADIPQLPRLRWVQKLQLFPALDWVGACLGLGRLPVPKAF